MKQKIIIIILLLISNIFTFEYYVDINNGNPGNDGLTPGTAKKYINDVIPLLSDNDKIIIAGGIYPETVVIDKNYVSISGNDSSTTIIDPPGDSTNINLYGIYSENQRGIVITNLNIIGCYNGIYLNKIEDAWIVNTNISECGNDIWPGAAIRTSYCTNIYIYDNYTFNNFEGIGLYKTNNCKVFRNFIYNNSFSGMNLSYCDNNYIETNTSCYNGEQGFWIHESDSNVFENNICYNNQTQGYNINSSSDYNTLRNNQAIHNQKSGFEINSSKYNTLYSNISQYNNRSGFKLDDADNNKLLHNYSSDNQTVTGYGFYIIGTSEQNSIILNVSDSNASYGFYLDGDGQINVFQKNNFIPSRINPDSGIYNNNENYIDFAYNYWSSTDTQDIEDAIHGIYSDSIQWAPYRFSKIDTNPGADTIAPATPTGGSANQIGDYILVRWNDVTTNEETGGYQFNLMGYNIYRLVNLSDTDDWTKYLIGTTTETQFIDTPVYSGNTYYYRITSFDTHIGIDGNIYTNESSWFRYFDLNAKLRQTIGSNIWYVDIINGDTNNSGLAPDEAKKYIKHIVEYDGIGLLTEGDTIMIAAGTYHETVTLNINNITIIGDDTESTIINPDNKTLNGFNLTNINNIIIKNIQVKNCYYGIHFENVDTSYLYNCYLSDCDLDDSSAGLCIDSGCINITIDSTLTVNNSIGLKIKNSDSNHVIKNTSYSNTRTGLYIQNSNMNYIFANKIRVNNLGGGFLIYSDSNYISHNTFEYNKFEGLQLFYSNYNILKNNTFHNNNVYGLVLQTSNNNYILENYSNYNKMAGYSLFNSHENVFRYNHSKNNSTKYGDGFYISGSDTNIFVQNTSEDNNGYGFYITGNCYNDTFIKNNIVQYSNADSNIYINSNNNFQFEYCYWNTTDSDLIHNRINGLNKDNILIQSFRISPIGISQNDDTVAPGIPEFNNSIVDNQSCTIFWNTVTENEEPGNYIFNIDGYYIFRSMNNPNPSDWYSLIIATGTATYFTDTTIIEGNKYYYRIASLDNYTNVSQLSSIQAVAIPYDTSGADIWYVDIVNGDTLYTGLTPDAPKKYIKQITHDNGIGLLTTGDTIIIAPGIYREPIYIDTEYITILGNSTDTVLLTSYWDTSSGLYSKNTKGLIVKDIYFYNFYSGIVLDNTIDFTLNNLTIGYCTGTAILCYNTCYDIEIHNNLIMNNMQGIKSLNSKNILITDNIINNNNDYGITIDNTNSTFFYDNYLVNNDTGLYIKNCDYNVIFSNSIVNNNTGLKLINGNNNSIFQNNIQNNDNYQIYISNAGTNNYINKNNIKTSSNNPDSGLYNNSIKTIDINRNYWFNTNTEEIMKKIYYTTLFDSSNIIIRKNTVDTIIGNDTIAPETPSNLSIIFKDDACVLQWDKSTSNDEPGNYEFNIDGYNIYRIQDLTLSDWTTYFIGQTKPNINTFQDPSIDKSDTYFYVVTAFDEHIVNNTFYYNESSFSEIAEFNLKALLPTVSPYDIFISPNPYKPDEAYDGNIHILFNVDFNDDAHFKLYNILGEMVYKSDRIRIQNGQNHIVWDPLSSNNRLSSGTYILLLEIPNQKPLITKIIIIN